MKTLLIKLTCCLVVLLLCIGGTHPKEAAAGIKKLLLDIVLTEVRAVAVHAVRSEEGEAISLLSGKILSLDRHLLQEQYKVIVIKPYSSEFDVFFQKDLYTAKGISSVRNNTGTILSLDELFVPISEESGIPLSYSGLLGKASIVTGGTCVVDYVISEFANYQGPCTKVARMGRTSVLTYGAWGNIRHLSSRYMGG